MLGELTHRSVEQSLILSVARGEQLDLAGDGPVDEAAMRSWGEDRTISASVIRDLLRGRLVADPDPHGLRLRGARIAGRIDLENITTKLWLELSDCYLTDGVNLRDAQLPAVALIGCRIEQPAHSEEAPVDAIRVVTSMFVLSQATVLADSAAGAVKVTDARVGILDGAGARSENTSGPALVAEQIQASQAVDLRELVATGVGKRGTISLDGARISGVLAGDGARCENTSGPALSANRMQVDHGVFLRELVATGAGEQGAVHLSGARISGQLACEGAQWNNTSGPALSAESMQVDHDALLRELVATGGGEQGAIHLGGTRIGGQLACEGAQWNNTSGPALSAARLQVTQSALLRELVATGAGEQGTIDLSGARIGGQLFCPGARWENTSGPALVADGLQVDDSVFLNDRFVATGAGEGGTVRLPGARISGVLACAGARWENTSGPALVADSLQVDQGVFLNDGLVATGAGAQGTVRLPGARISSQLACEEALWENTSGPALVADNMQVDHAVLLLGLVATGAGEEGAIHLSGARIGGVLACNGARWENTSGPALVAHSMQVDQSVFLHHGFAATGGGERSVLNLAGGRIGGELWLDVQQVSRTAVPPGPLVHLDGLTYTGLPQPASMQDWRDLLRNHTPGYAAQPYQHLAAAYRAAGHDRDARDILIEQRRDQLRRTGTTRRERAWGRITDITLGFGYKPWRALYFLIAALAVAVAVAGGHHGGLEIPKTTAAAATAAAGEACPFIDQVGVGLDPRHTPAQNRCQ
ncbi:hypothetical protein KRMM14A1259_57560 [Krasilnikovia sp. MM14-A1259]